MNVDTPRWRILPPRGDPVGAALRSVFAADSTVPPELEAPFDGFNDSLPREPEHEEGLEMPRELIDTGRDKRFVRRDQKGQFKESDDVGRSLSADRRRAARTKVKKGEGDKGDR